MLCRKTPWFLALVAVVLLGCAPEEGSPGEETAAPAAEPDVALRERAAAIRAIDELENGFMTAFNAGDAAGIAALFDAEGTDAVPLVPTMDRAGVEAAYAALFERAPGLMLEIRREDAIVSGGWWATWGTFAVTGTAEGGQAIGYDGRYGVVSRRQVDGSWKIYRHLYNYVTPPPGFGG